MMLLLLLPPVVFTPFSLHPFPFPFPRHGITGLLLPHPLTSITTPFPPTHQEKAPQKSHPLSSLILSLSRLLRRRVRSRTRFILDLAGFPRGHISSRTPVLRGLVLGCTGLISGRLAGVVRLGLCGSGAGF